MKNFIMSLVVFMIATFPAYAFTGLAVTDSIGIGEYPYEVAYLDEYFGPDTKLFIPDPISGKTIDLMKLSKKESEKILTHNPDNAQSSRWTLAHISDWIGNDQFDEIIIAIVLHDIARVNGHDNQVPIDEFEDNMRQIITIAQAHANKVMIVGGTVVPPSYPQDYRSNLDLLEYNKKLKLVAKDFGCRYVDLYKISASNLQWYPNADVHPTILPGFKVLGEYVAHEILIDQEEIHVPLLNYMGYVFLMALMVFGYFVHLYRGRRKPLFIIFLDKNNKILHS